MFEQHAFAAAAASNNGECFAAGDLEIDLNRSFSYSDSATDLPMLQAVGHPVVVNPDRELRRAAAELGWQVEFFRNPVSVMGRLPQLRAPEVSAGTGLIAAAAVGAAALVWWFARRSSERANRTAL